MSRVVVADKYFAPRVSGKFDKNSRILKRKGMKVMETYIEEFNASFDDNGHYFEIDEESTKLRLEAQEVNNKERAKRELIGKASPQEIAEALKSNEEPNEDLEALKEEYKELTGEEAKGNWGVKKLTTEISKLK